MSQAYPLAWPTGWQRHMPGNRVKASFGKMREHQFSGGRTYKSKGEITLAEAVKKLMRELDLLGAQNEILSTNVQLRLDGMPRSGQAQPADPGAAIYFDYVGRPTALACDKWSRVEDNIAALAKHIEAMRGMDRWGVGTVAQAFTGYQALPAPDPWWKILNLPDPAQRSGGKPWSAEVIREAWAKASREAHPDRPGGSHDKQARVNAARDEGLKQVLSA